MRKSGQGKQRRRSGHLIVPEQSTLKPVRVKKKKRKNPPAKTTAPGTSIPSDGEKTSPLKKPDHPQCTWEEARATVVYKVRRVRRLPSTRKPTPSFPNVPFWVPRDVSPGRGFVR